MKLINKLIIAITITATTLTLKAQDSLYIYKDGIVIDKHQLTDIDSVIFYKRKPVDLKIGDAYKGGVVAYIFQQGDYGYVEGEMHGIIAATYDQSSGIYWDENGYSGSGISVGLTGIDIGSGKTNTLTIISSIGSRVTKPNKYAAKLCNDLELNGYSDWFLPSKKEMQKLFDNRGLIGGFGDYFYWSSSEVNGDNSYTISFFDFNGQFNSFSAGDWNPSGSSAPWKQTNNSVRAVRYF